MTFSCHLRQLSISPPQSDSSITCSFNTAPVLIGFASSFFRQSYNSWSGAPGAPGAPGTPGAPGAPRWWVGDVQQKWDGLLCRRCKIHISDFCIDFKMSVMVWSLWRNFTLLVMENYWWSAGMKSMEPLLGWGRACERWVSKNLGTMGSWWS